MTAVPILYGTKARGSEFLRDVPLNLEPVVFDSGISKGQLKTPRGVSAIATGPGGDRGGIWWNGACHRIMGTKLIRIDPGDTVSILGDVGGAGLVSFAYGFDRLAIRSGTALYYWNGETLTQVTDEDLGIVVDLIWIDGYYMTTDGTSVVVTELADPTQVHPLKYGGAEEDPDAITGLIKVNNEAYVIGRHTVQVFRNVGGNGFPFQTMRGATIPYGAISAQAKTAFMGSFAFVGSGKNEPLAVYVAGAGSAAAISTRDVVDALAAVQDTSQIVVESAAFDDETRLYVHLPDETWCFLASASQKAGEPVWYRLQSDGPYRLRSPVVCGGRIIVGDLNSSDLGEMAENARHFGTMPQWEFVAGLLYNESKGGIIHELELVGLPGRGVTDEDSTIFLSMTRDAENYGPERALQPWKAGASNRRLIWRPHARFWQYIGLKFRGYGSAIVGFSSLQARVEGLSI